MQETIIHPGIRGTRQLAAAFATVHLRNRHMLKKPDGRKGIPYRKLELTWGKRAGRPWRPEEERHAKAMRAAGQTSEQIAAALNRTVQSVNYKIGYDARKRSYSPRAA